MKKELEKKFYDQCVQFFTDTDEERCRMLGEISKNHLIDLTTNTFCYFDSDTLDKISELAIEMFLRKLSESGPNPTGMEVRNIWNQVVRDFFQNNYWGLRSSQSKKVVPLSEDQKIFREIAPYVVMIFFAFLGMKIIIGFAGRNYILNPDSENTTIFGVVLFLSFSVLFYFGWRLHRKNK